MTTEDLLTHLSVAALGIILTELLQTIENPSEPEDFRDEAHELHELVRRELKERLQ